MKVFISHISDEAPLALELKDWIESSFAGQCDVFVSSDKDSIPAGSKWLDKIDEALNEAKVFIVLCSSSSLSRPWINFETGCAWIRTIPVIPICHSGQKRNMLPAPISAFHALELENSDFVNQLLSSLAKQLGFSKVPRVDEKKMQETLLKVAGNLSRDQAVQKDGSVTSANQISAEELQILQVLAQKRSGDRHPNAAQLAGHANMPEQRMQYYLDRLLKRKLIYDLLYMGAPREYGLADEGRSLLFGEGLL